MKKIVSIIRASLSWVLLLSLLATSTVVPAMAADRAADPCAYATPVDINGSLRGYGSDGDEFHFFSLDLPTAGIMVVDIAASGAGPGPPGPGIFEDRCGGTNLRSQGIAVIERSATHLVLAARAPGTYFFRVAAQDPRYALGEYKLINRFVAATVTEEELYLETGSADGFGTSRVIVTGTHFYAAALVEKDEDEDEINPDPGSKATTTYDPSRRRLIVSLVTFRNSLMEKDEDEDEINPDPGSKMAFSERAEDDSTRLVLFYDNQNEIVEKDEDEDEINPDPGSKSLVSELLKWLSRPAATTALRFRHDRLCRAGEIDDHGDTFTCATPLAFDRDAIGNIGNEWGDDTDSFVFFLNEVRTVTIETMGDFDPYAELYDQSGQRLVRHADDSETRFRIVRTLGPGWYFIRVGAISHGEGSYRLNVKAQAW